MWSDLVGTYMMLSDSGVYKVIRFHKGSLLLEAASSDCGRVWAEISTRAVDRTCFSDYTVRFRTHRKEWLQSHPEVLHSVG